MLVFSYLKKYFKNKKNWQKCQRYMIIKEKNMNNIYVELIENDGNLANGQFIMQKLIFHLTKSDESFTYLNLYRSYF